MLRHIRLCAAACYFLTAFTGLALGGDRDLLIQHVHVVDVMAGQLVRDRTIVIRDGRVLAISGDESAPAGRETIDGRGLVAMPGLFDCHVHLGGSPGSNMDPREWDAVEVPRRLAGFLSCGVTTVRSLCDDLPMALALRRQIAAGELMGPDLLLAGPAVTAPGGHPTQMFRFVPELIKTVTRQVKTPAEAEAVVKELSDQQVDVIKAVLEGGFGLPKMNRLTLERLIQKSHERRIPVTVHVGSYADVKVALEAGADGIEHLPVDDNPGAFPELSPSRTAFFCPTLAVRSGFASILRADELFADPWLAQRVSPTVKENLLAGKGWWNYDRVGAAKLVESSRDFLDHAAAGRIGALRRGGWTVIAGSDCGNPFTFHGPSLIEELTLLEGAGLSRLDVIRAATIDAARGCRVEADAGSIEKGKVANIVLLKWNPLENLSHLRHIERVIVRGRAWATDDVVRVIRDGASSPVGK